MAAALQSPLAADVTKESFATIEDDSKPTETKAEDSTANKINKTPMPKECDLTKQSKDQESPTNASSMADSPQDQAEK